jgi:hypothetical protein
MIDARAFFRATLVAAVALSTGCVTVTPPRFLQLSSDREWAPTLTRARDLANDGRTAQADSLLAQYAASFPAAPQTTEVPYWRALFLLHAPTAASGVQAAIPLLQTYVAAGQSTEHWMEADALLRAASRVDTLTRTYVSKGEVATDAAAAAAAKTADAKAEVKTVTADTKAQDDEIRRLRDELAKSKDELERIKKRLAEPPKKPPGL